MYHNDKKLLNKYRLPDYNKLPFKMHNDYVKKNYMILKKKEKDLQIKRLVDVLFSIVLIVLLSPLMGLIAILIKKDSKGTIFYKQERVTSYGRTFQIIKFRTMEEAQSKNESLLTVQNDSRITKIGRVLRKYRIDEVPQLFNVLKGEMSFVGTRPEVKKYVNHYTDEMMATLLLPAGITSEGSIAFKDEDELLGQGENKDELYVYNILPKKMEYNLKMIRDFSIINDFKIMIKTVIYVIK